MAARKRGGKTPLDALQRAVDDVKKAFGATKKKARRKTTARKTAKRKTARKRK